MFQGVLLAGGLSSRMGEDKLALKLGDNTLFERAFNLLQLSGAEEVLVSGDVVGVDCITDVFPRCGPLGGIYSSLDYLKRNFVLDNTQLLIIPVDMPLLTVDVLTKVVNEAIGEKCCHFQGEVFPCVVSASEELHAYLHQLLSESTTLGGKRSMKGLMKDFLKAKVLSQNGLENKVFLNINRPEDWKQLLASFD